jgi:glucosamine--fructose-6-phosphate aminotransferase (isomerizing)
MKTDYEIDIYQQPDIIRKMIRENSEQIMSLSLELRSRAPRFALIAARGTSDNAAIYAKYLFGAFIRIPVGLAIPSLYTIYRQPPSIEEGVIVGISQSGQTPDVLAVLEEARKQGALTIAITNDAASPIARAADHSISLNVGEEKSVPASKTYTAQLATIAMLTAHWSKDVAMVGEIDLLGDLTEEVLSQNPVIQKIAQRLGSKKTLVVVGRGFNQCTTFEIALKIKELAYMVAEAYSAADFRHGPVAMLEPGFPVVAIAPKGQTLPDMAALISEMKPVNPDLAILSNDEDLLSQSDMPVRLPPGLPEWLSPIVATVPGQLLALHLCQFKGYNPDKPRGLKKVTLTY